MLVRVDKIIGFEKKALKEPAHLEIKKTIV